MSFLIWKRDIFCKIKEINGLRGGEHSFAAQISLQIDADIVKNSRFRTENSYNRCMVFKQKRGGLF